MATAVAQPKVNAPTGIVDAITRAANDLGVDPVLALAIAQQESGFNPTVIGDNGCSHGLFQLNTCGGEGAGMTLAQLNDPYTNAHRALSTVAQVQARNPHWSPGQIAAAAQRPADQPGYASKVNAIYYGLLGVVPGTSTTGGPAAVPVVDIPGVGSIGGLLGQLEAWGLVPFTGGQGIGPLPPAIGSPGASGGPLDIATFKAAARDAIQIALGGALIYFGVLMLMSELSTSGVVVAGRRGQKVLSKLPRPQDRETLAAQREAESRPSPSVRTVKAGGTPRMATWREQIAASQEEPF